MMSHFVHKQLHDEASYSQTVMGVNFTSAMTNTNSYSLYTLQLHSCQLLRKIRNCYEFLIFIMGKKKEKKEKIIIKIDFFKLFSLEYFKFIVNSKVAS